MSTINRDFRFQSNGRRHSKRHPALSWGLFGLLASVVIGVVVANTADFNQSTQSLDASARQSIAVALPLKAGIDTATTPAAASISAAKLTPLESSTTTTVLPLPAKPANTDTAAHNPQHRISRESARLPLPELQARQQIIDGMQQRDQRQWQELKVRRGDSMAHLFKRAGLSPSQLHELMQSGKAVKKLKRIFPGDTIRVLTDDNGVLLALSYEINHKSYLLAERHDGKLVASIEQYDIEKRTAHASGSIKSSLFLAAAEAGISENLIMELAGIFGWDIDFVLDIRKGDTFHVLYEELYRNGEKIADGDILAAEFVNNGKAYRAVRYVNPQTNHAEYFNENGNSMRKAFLRSPVNFTRISSKFSTGRYHPVLHKIRAHKGVDYAAKRGTPVRAAGDGKIIYRGKKGGYGKVVIIQHGSRYSTLYAHLSNYKRGQRVGSRVKQGETIGFVGSSGLATGPHLHYEFRVNGVHRNPLTVRLPDAQPVPKRYRHDFETKTRPILAQLEQLSQTQLASNE